MGDLSLRQCVPEGEPPLEGLGPPGQPVDRGPRGVLRPVTPIYLEQADGLSGLIDFGRTSIRLVGQMVSAPV